MSITTTTTGPEVTWTFVNRHARAVCPECLTSPAPDQRAQARDGRCDRCVREMKRAAARRAREREQWAA